MTNIELDGYIADGKGGSEKGTISVNFNAQHLGPQEQGFHFRLTEAGLKMDERREIGVFLSPEKWQALIGSMTAQIAVLDAHRALDNG